MLVVERVARVYRERGSRARRESAVESTVAIDPALQIEQFGRDTATALANPRVREDCPDLR